MNTTALQHSRKVAANEGAKPDRARYKGTSVQGLLDEETVAVPWVLRQDEYTYLGSEDLPNERYVSKEFLALEAEKLWPRVWQLACFEQDIPHVGDTIVYDIMDWSFVMVRVAPDEIKGFYNSCLHRGRQLRSNTDCSARLPEIRCPFHGFAWNIDGSLKEIPPSIAWDFPHVEPAKFCLPEVRVESWDGFVFINMDHDAEPLMAFLGDTPKHIERWPFANRWKAVHVAKIIGANWKVAQEAFLESYHVITTHPQMNAGLLGGDGSNCEYDIYEGQANFNRMILSPPMPNPNLPYEVTEAELVEEMFYRGGVQTEGGFEADGEAPKIPEGVTARRLMADAAEQTGMGSFTAPGSEKTLIELTSAIQYFIFPNIFPWSGPIFYRFRPYGWDPDRSIMEVMYMVGLPEGQERPPPARVHWLSEDDDWTEAPELGMLGEIFNQDTGNIPYIQRGLKAAAKPGVTLGDYQDIRIRHYHQTLDRYLQA